MSNPSNLYAEKIYAEHPLILWPFDEKLDYVSLITESQRDITDGWTIEDGSASEATSITDEPFQDSITIELEGSLPSETSRYIKCISPNIINFTSLDLDLNTFCVGTYIYIDSEYINSASIGFQYTDTTSSLVVEKLETFTSLNSGEWIFISGTFEIPNENTNLRIVLKVDLSDGGLSTSDYKLYVNGLSLGQWSEEFNKTSLGISLINLPSNIALDQTYAVEAQAYGVQENSAYYLSDQTSLKAKNSSIPLVYGANNSTIIYPQENIFQEVEGRIDRLWQDIQNNEESDLDWQYWLDNSSWAETSYVVGNKPSLIIPGQGFLNKIGKYRDYTVEFWLRANCDTKESKRIFGPINSSDGIYVEHGFITLVIGKYFKSHFINDWFRPMLIDLRFSPNIATLMINGEEVISMEIDINEIQFPDQYDIEDKNQDWLGFYSYSDIAPLEIDCFAIYSYLVPEIVAKRRFVYGQGVLSPEGVNSSFGGVTAFIDYTFADYTANYKYPDFAKWSQGTFDNLTSNQNFLQTPQYSLPEIFTTSKTLQDLYNDNKDIQSGEYKFITFRPNSTWNSVPCYFNFNKFNFLADETHAVYAVVQINTSDSSDQTILKIYNSINGNSFTIKKDGLNISYVLNYGDEEDELYSVAYTEDQKIALGINIHELTDYFGGNVSAFFGNKNGLKLYVGGDETGTQTFTGYIYTVGFCTALNLTKIDASFLSTGIMAIVSSSATSVLDHIASYTLSPFEKYETYFLDISVSGYWEDYLPLSYFGQYVKDKTGNDYYDLDFLQFNIGYPSPSIAQELEVTSPWSYGELEDSYSTPTQESYSQIDNALYTGFNNYEDLEQQSDKYYQYDTSGSYVNSYITFQYIVDGANKLQEDFTQTEPINREKVVDATSHQDWEIRKFEVVDNTIIYPPQDIDFTELAIVYHIDFNVKGIISQPMSIRSLEIASQALNNNSFNPVGTRFGPNLFPYKKSGFYYDYKSKNPFSIYKGSSPYLYLTKNSGIELRGDFSSAIDRGISFPINSFLSTEYKVSSIQLWTLYSYDLFPVVETPIFEIKYKSDTIKFYIIANDESGKRAKIFAKSEKTGNTIYDLKYYLNGKIVREPVLTRKEWSAIAVQFPAALDFNSYLGSFNINGPILVNNISYYQANNIQQFQSRIDRSWQKVKNDGVSNINWSYWLNNFTWGGTRSLSETDIYLTDPSNIYRTYLGTNKTIVDDGNGFILDSDKIKLYSDISWFTSVQTAV